MRTTDDDNREKNHLSCSIFDQEPKQTISFPGGACLDNFEGKLMLCTQDIIFTLHPVPWDQQVTELLKQKKVSEALELAKYAHKTSLTPEEQRDVSFPPIARSKPTVPVEICCYLYGIENITLDLLPFSDHSASETAGGIHSIVGSKFLRRWTVA